MHTIWQITNVMKGFCVYFKKCTLEGINVINESKDGKIKGKWKLVTLRHQLMYSHLIT